MSKIALLTSLFDYPDHYKPTFYDKALSYFSDSDIHIARFNNLISGGYYDKLYYYKIPALLNYIEQHIIGKYEYILFLDATDTNFYRSPENIVEQFLNKGCSIIMGAEKGMWPPTTYSHLYSMKAINSEYKYLNSGTYFGFVDKIISHMENIIDKVYDTGIDDQGKWTIEYLLSDDIIIDENCEFFMSSLNSKKYVDIIDGKAKINGFHPIIVHDNGPYNEETIKLVDKV